MIEESSEGVSGLRVARELLELRRQIRGKKDGLRGTGVRFREAREE